LFSPDSISGNWLKAPKSEYFRLFILPVCHRCEEAANTANGSALAFAGWAFLAFRMRGELTADAEAADAAR